MVGHTHEDVDQMFSWIATHMSRKDAHIFSQLLEQGLTPSPVVHHRNVMYDYKGQMMYAKGLIEGTSSVHAFTSMSQMFASELVIRHEQCHRRCNR